MSQNKSSKTKQSDQKKERNSEFMDPVVLSKALMDAYERSLPLVQKYYEKVSHDFDNQPLDPFNVREAYIQFFEKIAEDPNAFMKMQSDFWQDWMKLWQDSTLRFLGEPSEVNSSLVPDAKDRRFRAPEWQESAVFDFIKKSYLLTCQWMDKTIHETRGLKEEDKRKLEFYTKLFVDALSPSNFVLTNPEVLKETLDSGGQNLVKGLENLLEDLERGKGELAITTTNYKAFKLGENIAATAGKVVYQNDLVQIIQYEPTTKQVYTKPLLVVPPWINKYYILDLQPKNSYLKWCIDQGYSVFVLSWVNPDTKLAKKRFEDYMEEGILSACSQIQEITGQKEINAVGYCLGGTLLTITLAYLAKQKKRSPITSVTFLTTLIDFADSGDLQLFMDDAQLELMDRDMAEKGLLEAKQLQRTFSLLRANDMIWSFVINNYLMGKEPFPFDLLYWNDDSTNMPAAMHSFYLRKMYRDNLLAKPEGISMNNIPIDVRNIKVPAYFLSTREDHIAPWKATYAGTQLFGGDVQFTLAASGHTAGVVNHPDKNKYCYWSSAKLPKDPNDWMKSTKEHAGSWWPHWEKWLKKNSGEKVPARKIKGGLENAPGSFVKVKS